jgi:hypothetical protein
LTLATPSRRWIAFSRRYVQLSQSTPLAAMEICFTSARATEARLIKARPIAKACFLILLNILSRLETSPK